MSLISSLGVPYAPQELNYMARNEIECRLILRCTDFDLMSKAVYVMRDNLSIRSEMYSIPFGQILLKQGIDFPAERSGRPSPQHELGWAAVLDRHMLPWKMIYGKAWVNLSVNMDDTKGHLPRGQPLSVDWGVRDLFPSPIDRDQRKLTWHPIPEVDGIEYTQRYKAPTSFVHYAVCPVSFKDTPTAEMTRWIKSVVMNPRLANPRTGIRFLTDPEVLFWKSSQFANSMGDQEPEGKNRIFSMHRFENYEVTNYDRRRLTWWEQFKWLASIGPRRKKKPKKVDRSRPIPRQEPRPRLRPGAFD